MWHQSTGPSSAAGRSAGTAAAGRRPRPARPRPGVRPGRASSSREQRSARPRRRRSAHRASPSRERYRPGSPPRPDSVGHPSGAPGASRAARPQSGRSIGHNGAVTGATGGKRAGVAPRLHAARRQVPAGAAAARPRRHAVAWWPGATSCTPPSTSARSARGGDSTAWWFLALASVGAVACLFFGLMLVARLLRRLGITRAPGADLRRRPGRPSRRVRSAAGGLLASGPATPADELQPRPGVVDRGDLDVDEARARSPRSRTRRRRGRWRCRAPSAPPSWASRPRPCRRSRSARRASAAALPASAVRGVEGQRDVERDAGSRRTTRAPVSPSSKPSGARSSSTTCVVLDPELAHQRGAGVAGHRASVCRDRCSTDGARNDRRGGAGLAPPLVFPGPSAGVEAADEVCGGAQPAGTTQPLAGLTSIRGVERVELLDPVHHRARRRRRRRAAAAMSQRVSPVPTCTTLVGSGVPGSPVATEPAAVTKTPTARTTSSASTTTTTPTAPGQPHGAAGPDGRLAGAGRSMAGRSSSCSSGLLGKWGAGVSCSITSSSGGHRQSLWTGLDRRLDQTFDRTCVRS